MASGFNLFKYADHFFRYSTAKTAIGADISLQTTDAIDPLHWDAVSHYLSKASTLGLTANYFTWALQQKSFLHINSIVDRFSVKSLLLCSDP